MKLERLLVDLKGRCRSRKREFEVVVAELKKMKPREAEDLLTELDEKIFSQIDCLECGNCCRALGPRLIDRDLRSLGAELGLKPGSFRKSYVVLDEDGDMVFSKMPCPFLEDDNKCAVYEGRPKACAEYPHTSGRQVQGRLGLLMKNAETCPAVFLMLDELRKKGFDHFIQ
ncbi:MAG: YkgJ family cysteine cluster protein [Spirochaetales bacterium]|nr:YkgJ family cysteine cluster protein [Spirochaetales bacterium]